MPFDPDGTLKGEMNYQPVPATKISQVITIRGMISNILAVLKNKLPYHKYKPVGIDKHAVNIAPCSRYVHQYGTWDLNSNRSVALANDK